MRAVIQAVSSASVRVNGGEPRAIGPGLMILLGVRDTDSLDIVPKLADKCAGLRIFPDAEGKLNLSAKDLGYSALVVSQFTLYGDTKKGYRPSFIKAAKPRIVGQQRMIERSLPKLYQPIPSCSFPTQAMPWSLIRRQMRRPTIKF